jgi:phage shock protein PspC (stress-responsive transcriptional regulator)
MLAGVAGGLAELIDADPSLIRIVWALLVFLTGGIALIVYVVMAVVVPERPDGLENDPTARSSVAPPSSPIEDGSWVAPDGSRVPLAAATAPAAARVRRRDRGDRARGGLVAGLLLILVGGFFLIRQVVPSIDLGFWWPTVAIAFGVLLVVLALLPSRDPG